MEEMKKHWKYLKYLLRHKYFVFVAGRRIGGISLWRLLIHDWTKFLPVEWFAYVEMFYGEARRLKKEEPDDFKYWNAVEPYQVAFDNAWLHHQHWNKHHWQHWVLRNDDGDMKLLKIPQKYLREMVADWCGAGRGITGNWEVWKWYEKTRWKILMHPRDEDAASALVREVRLRIQAGSWDRNAKPATTKDSLDTQTQK